MSGIRQQRPSSTYLAYPAQVLDDTILQRLGLICGTRSEEVPPKVVMTRADWDRLIRAVRAVPETRLDDPAAAHRAILFLGKSWRDNPLMERPPEEPPPARPKRRVFPVKKPNPFAHLFALPVPQAVGKVRVEHEIRVAKGEDEGSSLATLKRALEAIKRAALKHVESQPFPVIEGEDPPSPRELSRALRIVQELDTLPEPDIVPSKWVFKAPKVLPPKNAHLYAAYPAEVLDPMVLDRLGLLWGTSLDATPPKVVMPQSHWAYLLAKEPLAKQAIRFLGTDWKDNPTIQRQKGSLLHERIRKAARAKRGIRLTAEEVGKLKRMERGE